MGFQIQKKILCCCLHIDHDKSQNIGSDIRRDGLFVQSYRDNRSRVKQSFELKEGILEEDHVPYDLDTPGRRPGRASNEHHKEEKDCNKRSPGSIICGDITCCCDHRYDLEQ